MDAINLEENMTHRNNVIFWEWIRREILSRWIYYIVGVNDIYEMYCTYRLPLAHPHPNNHNINASLSVTVKCYRNLKDYIFYSFPPLPSCI